MNTVTLYSEQGSGYSLSPEGHDDGGENYTLPDGYTLAESQGDPDELFDEKGRPCVIVMHSSGLPELVSLNRSVVLRRQGETKNRGG